MQLHRGVNHYGRSPNLEGCCGVHFTRGGVDYPIDPLVLRWATDLVSGRTRIPTDDEFDNLINTGEVQDPWVDFVIAHRLAERRRKEAKRRAERSAQREMVRALYRTNLVMRPTNAIGADLIAHRGK